uniref:Uncharacterized protein n=1 Tax=Opuntia streptacantha TaxID=393608 RepID=A0A7C9EMU6_OPUST
MTVHLRYFFMTAFHKKTKYNRSIVMAQYGDKHGTKTGEKNRDDTQEPKSKTWGRTLIINFSLNLPLEFLLVLIEGSIKEGHSSIFHDPNLAPLFILADA